ncbi:hypothetical protein PV326_010419, partial [Microctonus aethiopoides]
RRAGCKNSKAFRSVPFIGKDSTRCDEGEAYKKNLKKQPGLRTWWKDASVRADCAPSTPGCTNRQVVLLAVVLYWGKGWEGVDRFTPGRVYANPGKDAQYVP